MVRGDDMRFSKSFPGFIVVVLLLALLTTACSGSDDSGDTAAPVGSEGSTAAAPGGSVPAGSVSLAQIGQPAPNFEITVYETPNFTKNQVLQLSELKGKPVVINFWFPSCYECGDLMWLLKGSYDKHKDDVQYVAIQVSADSKSEWDPGSNASAGQEYVTDKNLEFAVGADPDRSIATAYDVKAYPTTYFLDKDLKLVSKETFLRARQIEENIQLAMK
jgi:peroxiredoxin